MMKPPNVAYVYPLTMEREEVEIPASLAKKDSLVVFNVESERTDDIMQDLE